MLIVLLSAVLPALALLYFIYRKDDLRKEPAKQIVRAFLLGVASALLAIFLNSLLLLFGFYSEEPATVGGHLLEAFFGAGLPEELAKLALLLLFLRRNPDFDEWVDGIVYAASLGLGFAALENIFYLFDNLDDWAAVGTLRAFLSIPAHFFFAVTMGYFVSRAFFGDPSKTRWNLALALICPVILHTLFDFPLMLSRTAEITGGLFALFCGVFIFMAVKSKEFYLAHHARDAEQMNQDHGASA